MSFAHQVRGKSTQREAYSTYVINAVLQDIGFLDHKKIILKTDREPAMTALQERIWRLRIYPGEQTILENSPVGESQANGVVEKAVQEVEGMIRTLKSALEERLKVKIEAGSPIMPWLVEYSAVLLNVYRVGKDQKTAMDRHKGVKHIRPIAEFGESIGFLCHCTSSQRPDTGTRRNRHRMEDSKTEFCLARINELERS